MPESVTGVLGSFAHLIWVGDLEAQDEVSPSLRAGLVIASWPAGPAVMLDTATHTGRVCITLSFDEAVFAASEADWEDVSTVFVILDKPAVSVVPMGGDGEVLELELPRPGAYELRVSGRGRSTDEAAVGSEEYLIEVWPAAQVSEPAVLKLTSQYGRLAAG